jgi:hypothetical protein
MKYGTRGSSGGHTKKGSPDRSMIKAGTSTGLAHVDSIHYADEHSQHPEAGRQQRNQAQSAISGLRHKQSGPSGSLGKNPG